MSKLECRTRLIYRPEYQSYDFGPQHPLRPERLRTSLDLFDSARLSPDESQLLVAPEATQAELQLVHDPAYVDAVQRLDLFADDAALAGEADRWGLGPGDSPSFAGMHRASALIAGGSLHALRGILDGAFQHAFNPAGGLHHALRNRASGFCIYNDAAIAIAAALQQRESRVLYVDFDAHHGDGVQAAFYDEPRVLTFSIHETGRHLFPGTGFLEELGQGLGRGYSLNLPVEPFTEDDSWIDSLKLLLEPIAEWFGPDVIVSQHGCDSHYWDPLTDLRLSTRAFAAQAQLVHTLAHRFADGRWLALGGGGYEWVRVVPRSWAIVWSQMTGQPLPERIFDDADGWPPTPRREQIATINRARAEALHGLVLPSLIRQVYPAYRIDAGPSDLSDVLANAGADPPRSHVARLETPRGLLLLRDLCPPSLLERLRPDPGLIAFTRRPEREHALALRVATTGQGLIAVAHTRDGSIVGQIVLTPAEDWWSELPAVYELSIETSRDWRRLGIARALLEFCLQPRWLEYIILVAMGLDWHWDLDGALLDAPGYRNMLRHLFETVGFRAMRTSEPNVAMHSSNVLLVRMGANVRAASQAAFNEALFIAPWQRRPVA